MDNRVAAKDTSLATTLDNTIAHLRASDLHLLLATEADLEDGCDVDLTSDLLDDGGWQLFAKQIPHHLHRTVDDVAVVDLDPLLFRQLAYVRRDGSVEVDDVTIRISSVLDIEL